MIVLTYDKLMLKASHAFICEIERDLADLIQVAATAEYSPQSLQLLCVLPKVHPKPPAYIVYLSSDLTLSGLREMMGKIPNPEMMLESLDFVEDFNGRHFGETQTTDKETDA